MMKSRFSRTLIKMTCLNTDAWCTCQGKDRRLHRESMPTQLRFKTWIRGSRLRRLDLLEASYVSAKLTINGRRWGTPRQKLCFIVTDGPWRRWDASPKRLQVQGDGRVACLCTSVRIWERSELVHAHSLRLPRFPKISAAHRARISFVVSQPIITIYVMPRGISRRLFSLSRPNIARPDKSTIAMVIVWTHRVNIGDIHLSCHGIHYLSNSSSMK
jgi:hypothetical protein